MNKDAFVDPATSELYPGVKDKWYYGWGPIMMSWNFNYGLFSSIIYGDKNVLLSKPEIISADGKIGFMTAILLETNLGETEGSSVKRRDGHYRDFTSKMGVDITGEKLDTLGMKPF